MWKLRMRIRSIYSQAPGAGNIDSLRPVLLIFAVTFHGHLPDILSERERRRRIHETPFSG